MRGCWQIPAYFVTCNGFPSVQRVDQCVYTGRPMCIYGDMVYPLRVQLQTPFRPPLAPPMQEYNESMSSVRITVEWLFSDITNSFKFLDFKKNLKIGLSSVGKMYIVSALLRNAITCLYGNETSDYFGIAPPTLEEYFQ